MERLQGIYSNRWTPEQDAALQRVWTVLVRDYFQRFIDPQSTILDLAAGRCNFVNNVRARRRIAFDANPDVRHHAADGVEVIVGADLSLREIRDGEIDHVFVSNFLEHLPDAETALTLMETLRGKLRPGGSVMVLQPNFRYVGARYFDFIDHSLILTDRSLVEALEVSGFTVTHLTRRFLPYTAKSRMPKHPLLVRLYLRLPLLWRVFGEQTFAIAVK
jgi:hypothetical protein